MRRIAALSVCIFVIGISITQTTSAAKKAGKKVKEEKVKKTMIYGSIRTMRNKPLKGVQAFVYRPDTTIIASGFTDTSGKFETNGVPAGVYSVKVVYPSTKTILVTGITLKDKSMELNLKGEAPEADTTFAYEVLMPKPDPKKAVKKK